MARSELVFYSWSLEILSNNLRPALARSYCFSVIWYVLPTLSCGNQPSTTLILTPHTGELSKVSSSTSGPLPTTPWQARCSRFWQAITLVLSSHISLRWAWYSSAAAALRSFGKRSRTIL